MDRTAVSRLKSVNDFDSLLTYLRDELDWPVDDYGFDDLTFQYTATELGLDEQSAAKVTEIRRLRPLDDEQPWGIFFLELEPKRLPVVALRRLLSKMTLKKRASSNRSDSTAWHADDILFISRMGESDERHLTFAHFSTNPEKADLPVLKVLGWDASDTVLRVEHVAEVLKEKLIWPEDPSDSEQWRGQWRDAFTLKHREQVTTAKEMASRLAELARGIRGAIREVLAVESENGPITKMMDAFRESLIHDLEPERFADTYAQTITYGLLSARITDPSKNTIDDIASHMQTNPFLKELMESFIHVGGHERDQEGVGLDFDELGVSDVIELLDNANMEAVVRDFGKNNQQEDPVIHFFEGFLQEYDKSIRKDRGVFYTPRPVVSFIVRSVDELLRTEFGLEDGLADTTTWGEMIDRIDDLKIPEGATADQAFVQILDPATGTGTFLVEVIDLIYQTMTTKWQAAGHSKGQIDQLWNDYVPKHLLPRLYGYELMMAPYAIAHMKIGLCLYETGYRFKSNERARVYLTDALEPAQDFSEMLDFSLPVLAKETEAVNAVKQNQTFTVVVGNPPYLREKEKGGVGGPPRIGGWVRSGDKKSSPLFEDFISPLRDIGEGVHAKLSYELSVMFWRLALWSVFERGSRLGVVSFISPRAYISGPGHGGMRARMRDDADKVFVVDLGGDNRGARKSENIFEIETGVAIGLCVGKPNYNLTHCETMYAEVTGSASDKLKHLIESQSITGCEFEINRLKDTKSFFPELKSAYSMWPSLTDILPWQHSGTQFKRLWPIAESTGVLLERWSTLVSLDQSERAAAFVETDARKASSANGRRASKKHTGIADEKIDSPPPKVMRYRYRTLDRQWAFVDERFADRIRPDLVQTLSQKQVFAATLMSKQLGAGPAVSVASELPDMDMFCNRGAKDIIPLYRDKEATLPNITPGFLEHLSDVFSQEVLPESIFCYCIGILAGSEYTRRFKTELTVPGPRIPISKDLNFFREIERLGAYFVYLHTYGERWLLSEKKPDLTAGIATIEKDTALKVDPYPETFQYEPSSETLQIGSILISKVSADVMNYSVSGFAVVRSWLRYRMKIRGGRSKRSSSSSLLDQIRPGAWTFTDELLDLLWTVEKCLSLESEHATSLTKVVEGECFEEVDFPKPDEKATSPPVVSTIQPQQSLI